MAKLKQRKVAPRSRKNLNAGKNRPGTRRQGSAGPQKEAPTVIANSVFALTLQPKSWAKIHDDLGAEDDPAEALLYKDLVSAYNYGAELVGAEKIEYKKSNASTTAIADLLAMFKKNILPEGFEVNIDQHYNKKLRRDGYHFAMYRACKFPGYWHFFELKHVCRWLKKTNIKLHDFFIVFLRSFIGYACIPTWFDGSMRNADFILSDYMHELRGHVEKGLDPDHLNRLGYSEKEIKQRLADIESTMKEYAKGEASEYMNRIIKTKPVKPHYLLRSLKNFPGQSKLVKFMKQACELMKESVGLVDFCYHNIDGDDYDGLQFHEQVAIIWDWHDHYSGTQARAIEDMANGSGVFAPTLCGRILPTGCGGLTIEKLKNCLSWPEKLTKLQNMFQEISERFTDYKTRELV